MNKNLPYNWTSLSLGKAVFYKKGKKPKTLFSDSNSKLVPYLDIKAFEKNVYTNYCDPSDAVLIDDDEIAIVWDGARSGWVSKGLSGALGSTLASLKSIEIPSDYLYRFLQFQYSYINTNVRGIGIPHVDPEKLWNISMPIPPEKEIIRINQKLEIVFKHIDSLNSRINTIPELLKQFRQQVLSYAVSGKLSNNPSLKGWKKEKAEICCLKVQSGGTPKSSGFAVNGIPFLKVYNIQNQRIEFDYKPQFVKPNIHSSQGKKSITLPGDVVMNIVGPPLGKIAIIPDYYDEWNINQAITLFRPKKHLLNKFLYYFFCEGRIISDIMGQTRGMVGQINISLTQCRNFEIPIPPVNEQKEIIKQIEKLFAYADAIEEKYKKVLASVEQLPHSILKIAFEGALVKQNPKDEPAEKLVERIMKSKTEANLSSKKSKSKSLNHGRNSKK